MKIKHNLFPFTWNSIDYNEIGNGLEEYYDVEFIADFGIFKEGDKFDNLCISFDHGWIEGYGNHKLQYFKAVPIANIMDGK